jgi:hypothetical protein
MVDYRDTPPVHIFADTEAGLARMRGTAEAAGCRVISAQLIGPDAEPSPGAAVLIELEKEDADEAVVALLDRARCQAEQSGRGSVVSAAPGLIDLVAARAGHPDVVHLCDADEEERIAAVAGALRPREARVQDSRRTRNIQILQPLQHGNLPAPRPGEAAADAAFIRTMLRARRLRAHYFPAELFADPVWDMLLDLLAAQLEGKKVAVSSLCIAAAVPATTALRWIGVLTESGLAVRVADPEDGRRVHIVLAEPTARALAAWLREARRMGTAAV